jgi:hypothetical protein
MDEDRRIRFLIAPTLFIASLLLGALSDQTARDLIAQALKNPNWSKLIGLIAGGSVVVGVIIFAFGYVIGTLTYFLLRLFFRFRPQRWGKSRFHEVALSEDAFTKILEALRAPFGKPDRWQELSAGVAFDHGFLREKYKGIHQWLVRRWNAFSIAATSFWGLVLSFPFGHLIGIPMTQTWWIPVAFFSVILVFVGLWAWQDAMNMVDFMSRLPPNDNEAE